MESTPGSSRSRRQSRLPGPSRAHQPSAPFTPLATPPAAPRRSRHSVLVYSPDSTPSTPSLSAPPPFDWDAARNNLDPPFPLVGTANSANIAKVSPVRGRLNSMRKRIFRQSSIVQRLQSLPSKIMFEISMFPHNVPLPPSKLTGQLAGAVLHLTHMVIKWMDRSGAVSKDSREDIWKSEIDWEVPEDNDSRSWTTTVIAFLLFITTILNTLYLFTRMRSYQLQLRNELVDSKHASIVSKSTFKQPSAVTIPAKALSLLIQSIRTAWRLIFGQSPAPEDLIAVDLQPGVDKVQQLEVWTPGELETELFIVYSPAHFFVWRIFSSTNWFSSLLLLGIVSFQAYALIFSYDALIKDKAIIAAEMLHEYDVKFVNPRLHTIKRDVGTSTSEAEMVHYRWRKYD